MTDDYSEAFAGDEEQCTTKQLQQLQNLERAS
jgi:hypothetical protein